MIGPQEGGAVRLSHRVHPVAADRQPGGAGADALGQRGVDPAVHQSNRLTDLVGHLDPRADLLGAAFLVLDADQLSQPVASEQLTLLAARPASLAGMTNLLFGPQI